MIKVGDVVEWHLDDLPYGKDRNPGCGTVMATRARGISTQAAVIWFTGRRREPMWFPQANLILVARAK
jgi:hypothetical protein